MGRKKTSIMIEENVWRDARKKCLDLGIEASEYVEKLIVEDLKKKK